MANGKKLEAGDERRRRKRSPNHPAVGLEEAVEKIRTLYETEHDHLVSIEGVAGDFGQSLKSSSFQQTIAALNQFGLIEEEGRGDARRIKVSSLALNILDYPPESAERQAAMEEAALHPAIHSELWERWNGRLPPSDHEIRLYLVRQREGGRFHKDHVDSFITQFRATLAFARVRSGDMIDPNDEPPKNAPQRGQLVRRTSGTGDILEKQRPSRLLGTSEDGEFGFLEGEETGVPMTELVAVPEAPPPPSNPFAKVGKDREPAEGLSQDRLTLDEGAVVLEWPSGLSADSVIELEDWVNVLLRRAKRKAGITTKEIEDKEPKG